MAEHKQKRPPLFCGVMVGMSDYKQSFGLNVTLRNSVVLSTTNTSACIITLPRCVSETLTPKTLLSRGTVDKSGRKVYRG